MLQLSVGFVEMVLYKVQIIAGRSFANFLLKNMKAVSALNSGNTACN